MFKKAILAVLLAAALFSASVAVIAGGKADAQCGMKGKLPAQVLRHVVMFKFKDDASTEAIRKVETDFCALAGKIDTIMALEWGTNVSEENLSQGLTHCFTLTFASADDCKTYIEHPDHKAFGQSLGPVLDKAVVLDYWTKP